MDTDTKKTHWGMLAFIGIIALASAVFIISETRAFTRQIALLELTAFGPQPAPINRLKWGAYVGDVSKELPSFESAVGRKTDIVADFESWQSDFPSNLASGIGNEKKTLLIFWEPNFGYSSIVDGSNDEYIRTFANAAKDYGHPVILIPFDEMNIGEGDWGYGRNGNTAEAFKAAWIHVHDIFTAANATNVKFGIAYNNVPVPDVAGNQFDDYYPGSNYVDFVGVDGFNFGTPWLSFAQIFDDAIGAMQKYNKPIYIFSMGSAQGADKASWISGGLGSHVKTYPNLKGWIWFNQNDALVPSSGDMINWKVDSDAESLQAFSSIVPH